MPQLPDAPIRLYDSDTPAQLGGFVQMAGLDVAEFFAVRSIKDHPWLGLEITFPFPEVGTGKITKCLTHPLGELLFDVEFPTLVPPIQGFKEHYQVALKNYPGYHQDLHRFRASELKYIIDG